MSEPRIGRVLVASLHQAIADVLPMRLEFYENWLNASGLREGTIGLAPLSAVLSFLRSEGDAYQSDHERAGEYAAEWTVTNMPAIERRMINAMPGIVRARRRCVPREDSFARPIPAPAPSFASGAGRRRSICAARCSAKSASLGDRRCAGSTPPRSPASCSCSPAGRGAGQRVPCVRTRRRGCSLSVTVRPAEPDPPVPEHGASCCARSASSSCSCWRPAPPRRSRRSRHAGHAVRQPGREPRLQWIAESRQPADRR